jgi:hypothetical protein
MAAHYPANVQGKAVAVLEIHVHPIDSSEFSFKVAAARPGA